ncbi:MAG TPA: PD-(D/E)XK nuclease family protein [Firmicutes bacterium]|nr:PD-(D/E)XK nuclease family protein [Bacillota bacterium]
MTRAKELLVLSCFKEYQERQARRAYLSPFLRELVANQGIRGEFRRLGEIGLQVIRSGAGERNTCTVDCTQLLVYGECPRKYHLRYVCGFAPPIAPALGFGKVAHHVVCEMARRARNGFTPGAGDPISILRDCFYLPFASARQHQAMFDALLRRLTSYAGRHGPGLVRTLDVERRFEIPLDGAARLRGRIDLILKAGGKGEQDAVEIIDIKTAENRPPLPQHQNQLRLYAEAARRLGWNPVRLAIHDLDSEDGTVIPVKEDPQELDRFREEICRWIHGIRGNEFAPRRGDWCRGCDYIAIC